VPSGEITEFGGWRRPPRWVWAVAGVAAVAVLAGVVVAHGGPHHASSSSRSAPHPAWAINTLYGVDALAVGGSMLYVATEDYPADALSAFSRATGRLVRRVGVPAAPGVVRVGPGGLVWLTFYPGQNGGAGGLWLLSPDLGQRSALSLRAGSAGQSDVYPVGPSAAVVAANGLMDVHLPVPGHFGQWAVHRVSALPTDHGYDGAAGFARLAGRIAVLQNNNTGHYRIVLAGLGRRPAFDSGSGVSINSMASDGTSLWITTGPLGAAPMSTAVIRLNDRLQVVTPRSISNNPALAFPERVWATGNTVVVSTSVASKPLVCFRFQNGQAGPVTGIPARLPPGELAVAGDTIYAADAGEVVRYRLPAPCR
jgi:hypothetical protein